MAFSPSWRLVKIPPSTQSSGSSMQSVDRPNVADPMMQRGALAGPTPQAGPHMPATADLKTWLAAIAANPADARTWCGAATCWETLGSLDRARSHYERAIELDPATVVAHNNLGNLH